MMTRFAIDDLGASDAGQDGVLDFAGNGASIDTICGFAGSSTVASDRVGVATGAVVVMGGEESCKVS